MGLCSRELMLHRSQERKDLRFAEVDTNLIDVLTGGPGNK